MGTNFTPTTGMLKAASPVASLAPKKANKRSNKASKATTFGVPNNSPTKVNGKALPKGQILDYISQLPVKDGPEEREAVQVFARILVEDYGYPRENIRTRPQWTVKKNPSEKSGSYPIDIAVFDGSNATHDNLQIIVECKKPTRKDGVDQLKQYMNLSTATLGVWFNGRERQFLRKVSVGNGYQYEVLPNLPRYGQRVEDIGNWKRKELLPTHNLKSIFSVIRNHLAGNAVGTTRDEELARQLINIVFCKIWDERFTRPDDCLRFRAGVGESAKTVKKRIEKIFADVKKSHSEIIDVSDGINLDEDSVVYVVGELQNYCLIEAERDVIADAFETFISYALKGGQGQFFTPRNVVNLMTRIAKPTRDDLVIDPACGSGGFLVESLKSIWSTIDTFGNELGWTEKDIQREKDKVAEANIRGLEKDDFLSKVAKAYMVIIGDGKSGICCEDSLDEPVHWKDATQQKIQLGTFDLVLTNPPFGKDIKIIGEKKLQQFELAYTHKSQGGIQVKTNKKKDKQQPDVLFIERSLQLLKDGGRLGIVLPETFFHAPKAAYVRQMLERHNIFFVLDLPHNTFRPHNNAKCVAIFLQKNVAQQDRIGMAVAEEVGHDHNGKEIYRWDDKLKRVDKSQLWDDIPSIIQELDGSADPKYSFDVAAKECRKNGIYVPRFYWQKREREIKRIAKKEGFVLKPIHELISEGVISTFDGHGSPESENKGNGDVPYIRVKDIVNWEAYQDPNSKIPLEVYRSLTEKTVVRSINGEDVEVVEKPKALLPKDVLYVRRGSYRIGSVAMISPFDTDVLLTREISVIRVKEDNQYGINPYYLLYAMSHRLTQLQTKNKVLIETTLPNIGDRWKSLLIPIPADAMTTEAISKRIKGIIDSKWSAVEAIQAIKEELGDLTT